jgi:hypothetical protein
MDDALYNHQVVEFGPPVLQPFIEVIMVIKIEIDPSSTMRLFEETE